MNCFGSVKLENTEDDYFGKYGNLLPFISVNVNFDKYEKQELTQEQAK